MLELGNIRHAHSHLMFFGWVTLMPFLFISRYYSRRKSETAPFLYSLTGWLFWLALATWPAFLLYGYEPVAIGTADLPISVMLSGIIMIFWYLFMGAYLLTRKTVDDPAKPFYRTALWLLIVSSIGAWSVAAAQFLAPHNALLAKASTHFFLTVFSEGWCMLFALGTLNLIIHPSNATATPSTSLKWAIGSIAAGSLFLFPYAMGTDFISPIWLGIVRAASALTLIGYIMLLIQWWPSLNKLKTLEKLPILFLAFKSLMLAFSIFLPVDLWIGKHQIQIFYLHTSLMGFVSLTLLVYLRRLLINLIPEEWPFILFCLTLVLIWISLIPLTPFWPIAFKGAWIYELAALTAPLPTLAAFLLMGMVLKRNYPSPAKAAAEETK